MTRRPPRCTRPEPLLPSTSCFRSFSGDFDYEAGYVLAGRHDGSSGTIQVVAGARLEIRNGEGVNEDTTEPGLTLAFEEGSIGNLVVDGDGSMIELTQVAPSDTGNGTRSEEHTSELQSLMRISYAVFCLKKTKI